ncbi:MAG TPA: RNA polymerase sporulation sigma factor SigH [Acidimicrobiales bacterium]|jgi:RNA polymerase sporulation-specific sigma factor|nr:RNA polymerase sporulation sigma factor SigH [Acidimicrobiales bacterium]
MSDEELAVRFQDGDMNALDVLFERYRRFAQAKARTYFLVGAESDDIEQEGMIGLYKAARDYRVDREVPFRAFVDLCVTRQLISAVKAASRQKHRPLNQYVSISGHKSEHSVERSVEDLPDDPAASDPAEAVLTRERAAMMRHSVADALSRLEVDVLRLYVEGKSYQEIGDHLGRHVKSIDNALQRVKRKLDGHLAGDGAPRRPALVG